jgi:hypothetical protein
LYGKYFHRKKQRKTNNTFTAEAQRTQRRTNPKPKYLQPKADPPSAENPKQYQNSNTKIQNSFVLNI